MTQDTNHQHPDPSPPSLEQDIRLVADGEADSACSQRVEDASATDSRVAARVNFERELRARVGVVLSATTAPAGLRETVSNALLNSDDDRDAVDETSSRFKLFHAPKKADGWALAASLFIVAGAVLFGIFGTPIWQNANVVNQTTEMLEVTATYTSSEHLRCSGDLQAAIAKGQFTEIAEASRRVSDHLELPTSVPDLETIGLKFVGAGYCRLPGNAPSVHLLYRNTAGELISLFIQPDIGEFPLSHGELVLGNELVHDLENPTCIWVAGDKVYVLVADTPAELTRVSTQLVPRTMMGY